MDVLFCNCARAGIIPEDRKQRILAELTATAANVTIVPDLCGLSAERDPLLADLAKRPGLKIVACYPRAVRWLFHRGGAPLPADGAEVLNMRDRPAEDILASLALTPGDQKSALSAGAPAASGSAPRPAEDGDWVPWFPVIDYERCTNCKQCLEFCLFGVYEAGSDGKVAVVKPTACKTNCPACARICPCAAIIFPKVEDVPINGAEIEDEEKVRVNARVNVEEYLGENVYAALAVRKMKRKALLLKTRGDGASG